MIPEKRSRTRRESDCNIYPHEVDDVRDLLKDHSLILATINLLKEEIISMKECTTETQKTVNRHKDYARATFGAVSVVLGILGFIIINSGVIYEFFR